MPSDDASERAVGSSTSWDGYEYERVSELQRRVGIAFVESLDVTGRRRILDVGCGDGYLTERIAERSNAEVVGIDSSPAMLTRANTRATPRLRFVEQNASAMTFASPFDLIVSLNTLHWVLDLTGAFQHLFAAQTDGGQLVCQLVGASDVPSIEDAATLVTAAEAWREYFADSEPPFVHPTEAELRRAAEAGGYRVDGVDAWAERFQFPSEEHFERWCAAGMTAWTDRLPLDRRAPFIRDVTTRYAALTGTRHELQFSQVRLHASRSRADTAA